MIAILTLGYNNPRSKGSPNLGSNVGFQLPVLTDNAIDVPAFDVS